MKAELVATVRLCIMAALVLLPGCGDPSSGEASQDASSLSYSEFQQDILSDEHVTAAEYESSVHAAIGCIRSEGIEVYGPFESGYHLTYSYDGEGRPMEELNEIGASCYDEYQSGVEPVWGAQNSPTETERLAALEALPECLADSGIEVPGGADEDDLIQILLSQSPNVVNECGALLVDIRELPPGPTG